jgi:uncharacterized protein (DUF697 family)
MTQDEDALEAADARSGTLAARTLGPSRIGVYTALGTLSGVVPLPWLPEAAVRQIRGTLAHEVATRHGLSLTPEARRILASTSGVEGPRGMFAEALMFASTKVLGRFGPLGILAPVRFGVSTFLLGYLFQRYLEIARRDRAARVDAEEARRIRRAMDQAMLYVFTTEVESDKFEIPRASEDLRDGTTQLLDSVLISVANLPAWLVRRVEASFDELVNGVA